MALAAAPSFTALGQEWISLFNGKNLDGWTIKISKHPLGENFANTFHVEDGILKVSYDGYDRSIDAHVKNLRRKLEPDPAAPRYVETVYGVGYRFADEVA